MDPNDIFFYEPQELIRLLWEHKYTVKKISEIVGYKEYEVLESLGLLKYDLLEIEEN